MGGASTEIGRTTTDVVARGGALRRRRRSPATVRRHRLPSEAAKRFERGVDPELPPAAAQRAVDLLVDLRRRHGRRRRRRSPAARRAPAPIALPADQPPSASARIPIRSGGRCAGSSRSAARSPRGRRPLLEVIPPSLAARPGRPGRPGRGGRPAGGLRRDPVRAADRRRPGRGLTEAQRPPPVGRPRAGRGRLRRGARPTRSSPPACTTRSACADDDPRRHALAAGQPAVGRGAGAAHDAAARPARHAAAQRRPRAARRRALRGRPGLPARPSDPPPCRRSGWTAGRPTRSWPRSTPRCRTSRRTSRSCSPATASRPAGGAPARRPAGRTRSRRPGWSPATGRRRADGPGRPARAVAPRPVRRAAPSTTGVVGHAGELHPRVVAALELPARTVRDGARPRRARRRRGIGPRPGAVRPTRRRCWTSRWSCRTRPRPRRSRRRCGTAPAKLLESLRLFDVYTGRSRLGRGPQVAGVRAALPGPGPHADRRGGHRGARRGGGRGGPADRRRPARLTRRSRRPAEVLESPRAGTAGSGRARRRSPAPTAGRSGHAAAAPSRCPCGGRSRGRPHWPRSRPRAGPCRSAPWRRSGR